MYFKKLEIFGFKSFAEKTTLHFEPGITAVVGPNGCGKSNIFDSIRWVLGEQSVKELRGSLMEDVIFNGTDKKPSLGFAEVSLTFSNESRMLPIEYDEVTITRRLFRSGESEYLLNKTVVRLRDITELLMGTGIGAEAYSLIQQGKVDLVVSSKPEDRRFIIDEASGITRYKAKKKEALSKLKDAENNLLRLNDIVVEVKRQISSIERQANKARRYKEKYEKLKGLEAGYAKYQIENYDQSREQIQKYIQDLEENKNRLSEELEEQVRMAGQEIRNLNALEKGINDIHAEDIKLDGNIDLAERQVSFNQERIDTLGENDVRLIEQKGILVQRCHQQEQKIKELNQSVARLEKSIVDHETILVEKRKCLEQLEAVVHEAKHKIKNDEERIFNQTAVQVTLRNEMTDIIKELQGAIARKRRLEFENDKVYSEKKDTTQKLNLVRSKIDALSGEINELHGMRSEKEELMSRIYNKIDALSEEIDTLEKKKVFCVSQKEFIEKLHTQYQDIPDPVIEGRIITRSPPLDYHNGIIGKVRSVKSIDKDRLSLLSNNLFEAPASELYEIICETKFIELDPKQMAKKIVEITEMIDGIVKQRESLQGTYEEQKEILGKMEQEIHQKDRSCSILQAQEKDIQQEIDKLHSEIEIIDTELLEVKETLSSLKIKEKALEQKLDAVTQDIEWCQNDIKEQQEWIANKSQEKEGAKVLIAQLQTELESDKEQLSNYHENEEMFRDTLNVSVDEIKKIDIDLVDHLSRKQAYEREIEEFKQKIEEIKLEKGSIQNRLTECQQKKDVMSRKVSQFKRNRTDMEEKNESLKQEQHEQDLKLQEISFSEQGIKDRLLQTYKVDYNQVFGLSVQASIPSEETDDTGGQVSGEHADGSPHQDRQVEEKDLSSEEEMRSESADETPLAATINQSESLEIPDDVNWEDHYDVIAKLRKQCDSFGNVNLVAIEEYEELKERFEFLTQQQCDLIESRSNLMSTIKKINRSTRQMFMDTFTRVSEEFRIYYRMLFGGGEAQLVLLDPENVLESGIDIVARPPGKKLQNINLLSGGEKSLTAIALIFGVFKVNPSPFCILDEIDAALDESNVDRFSYLLKDFARIAQFIVITHNKKTITSANAMYGVTMPETGISRIVSVKFSEEEKDMKARGALPVGVS